MTEERTATMRDMAVLDLTGMSSPDELASVSLIENISLVLVPESLSGELAKIPMRGVASVVPVPDGADVRVHTGAAVFGGEALADPGGDNVVLVVTGTLALTSPVEHVGYRQVIVTGMVLAPAGSEGALAAGLTKVTGSVQYYEHVEGQRFRNLSGQTKISGEALANRGGNPSDVLFLTGQTMITGPAPEVGFQTIVAAGQLIAPRDSEVALMSALTMQGQLVWYDGDPRFFSGSESFGRAFFELLDDPLSLVLLGSFTIEDDVPPELLREKVSGITLVGKLIASKEVVPVLQLLVTEKQGTITTEQDAGER